MKSTKMSSTAKASPMMVHMKRMLWSVLFLISVVV